MKFESNRIHPLYHPALAPITTHSLSFLFFIFLYYYHYYFFFFLLLLLLLLSLSLSLSLTALFRAGLSKSTGGEEQMRLSQKLLDAIKTAGAKTFTVGEDDEEERERAKKKAIIKR